MAGEGIGEPLATEAEREQWIEQAADVLMEADPRLQRCGREAAVQAAKWGRAWADTYYALSEALPPRSEFEVLALIREAQASSSSVVPEGFRYPGGMPTLMITSGASQAFTLAFAPEAGDVMRQLMQGDLANQVAGKLGVSYS